LTADPGIGETMANNDSHEPRPQRRRDHDAAPWQEGQEWANALTHAIAATATLVLGSDLVLSAAEQGWGLTAACSAYMAAAFGTFLFSTLSHWIHRQPLLNTMRAWDQAMIYAMISGTYTPIVFRFASDEARGKLLAAIWVAAAVGFLGKVAFRHRINSFGAISYLLLGWLPAIPLAGRVPSELAWAMLAGGVLYTLGVIVLINDRRLKYLHAVWHLCVMTAATVHFLGIATLVVRR
jgi:hemolysin III